MFSFVDAERSKERRPLSRGLPSRIALVPALFHTNKILRSFIFIFILIIAVARTNVCSKETNDGG